MLVPVSASAVVNRAVKELVGLCEVDAGHGERGRCDGHSIA